MGHANAAVGAVSWQPIESAPLDKSLLLWWQPIQPNVHAEGCVIGQVSSHEPGNWYNPQTGQFQDLWHIRYWQPLPAPPSSQRLARREQDAGRDGRQVMRAVQWAAAHT